MSFKKKGIFHVYIVQCRDGSYYTGYTPDLKLRVKKHNAGKGARYTRSRLPVKLVWSKEYKYFRPAVKKEAAIKGLTRREKERFLLS